MTRLNIIRTAAVLATVVALGLVHGTPDAAAQCPVDPDRTLGIFQDGRLVGEIYRIDPDPTRYTEHWVLYPGYRDGAPQTILPGVKTYEGGLMGFLASVPFEPGSRYLHADCFDGTELPAH